MANERTVPLLPCASIDDIRDFMVPLGFAVTYRQLRPNPYLVVRREDLELHYFGIEGFVAEDSYGSCLVLVEDTEPLFEAFSAGLRATYGRLPLSGLPRITRPRRRKNVGNLTGFSLVDPGGNWIRVVRAAGSEVATEPSREEPTDKLSGALANAVVLADSKGDDGQAARILAGALSRETAAPPVARVEALAFLAELRVRLGDPEAAAAVVGQVDAVPLTEDEQRAARVALSQVDELRAGLAAGPD